MELLMKTVLAAALLCLSVALGARAGEETKPATPAAKLEFKSDKEKASYALGYDFAMRIKEFAADVNVDVMTASFKDAATGKQSRLSDAEIQKHLGSFSAFAKAKQTAKPGDKPATLENKDDVSYALGQSVGSSLKGVAEHFNFDFAGAAFASVLKNEKVDFDPAKDPAIAAYFQKIQESINEKRKAEGEKSKKDGEDFLAENKKKEGVVTTASGLQYKILEKGTGEIPKGQDRVKVSYEGRFINNVVFDSTAKHGGIPIETSVQGGVILGWLEALKLMPVGSKWELYIPSNLAYGEGGRGDIPPHAVLIFKIELVSIVPAQPK
jgi:FKBP-type peptidyl-prolyl cis-trans isomerase